jgi:hypothetical protein
MVKKVQQIHVLWQQGRGEGRERDLSRIWKHLKVQGIDSACLCSLAGRYNNTIPTRFLASIDCSKISAYTVKKVRRGGGREEEGRRKEEKGRRKGGGREEEGRRKGGGREEEGRRKGGERE